MGQIVKRRKNSRRESESDLHIIKNSSNNSSAAPPESDYRRSLRRRNARQIIDYGDYLDEYEEEMLFADEEDDERMSSRRRKKKKKLQSVVKMASEEDLRRRVGRGFFDEDYEAEVADDLDRENEDDDVEDGDLEGVSKEEESYPGTPADTQSAVPLPDTKLLEMILDKLQKKDIYGVYAEPVDPEELPDYFDIIRHPMDFATVRKKLANGKYSTFDLFEKDVFLICSNAMEYNESDTVYYKQARTIQEMAIKRFERIRSDFERSGKQIYSEDRNMFSHIRMNPVKSSLCQSTHEPVASDFRPGADLSIPVESQHGLNMSLVSSFGKPYSNSNDGQVECNISTMENDVDRAEEFVSGKNMPCKLGKKPLMLDENRRNTYKMSNQLTVGSDSIFTTFQKEPKEFVSVGLQAEYSYARSLARFAGTLGPVGWNIAANNIKEALSQGVKFGRGWVGEYEPVSTPFLKIGSQCNIGSVFPTALPDISHMNSKENHNSRTTPPFNFKSRRSIKDHPVNEPSFEGRPSFIPIPDDHPTKRKPPSIGHDGRGPITPASPISGRNPFSRKHPNIDARVGIQNASFPSVANPDKLSFSTTGQLPESSFVVPSHFTSQPPSKPIPFKKVEGDGTVSCGVPNPNISMPTFDKSRLAGISFNNISCPIVRSTVPSGYEMEHQGVSDPVHQMKMLAEKAQNQQNFVTHSPVSSSPGMPTIPSSRRYDVNKGFQVSPRSWMSIGPNHINKIASESIRPPRSHISAESLYNPARDVQQVSRFRGETPGSMGLHFQMEENHLPNQMYGRENQWMANEAQFQGHSVNMTKLVPTDLSRFQVQSPRQSLSSLPQKMPTLPPDLNVGFQSSGSPARQGNQVDPQQPDLALQL